MILKAFTKTYAMAGLRLGYAVSSNAELLDRMRQSGPPWSVSGPAQSAGEAALLDRDYLEKSVALLADERPALERALESLGLKVFASQANYVFFSSRREDLREALLPRGILLRSCGSYPGLDSRFYRAAVRLPEENRRLTEALREIGEEGQL